MKYEKWNQRTKGVIAFIIIFYLSRRKYFRRRW